MRNNIVKLKPRTEYQECKEFYEWSQYMQKLKGLVFHIPNEGKRSRVMGSLLKRIGLVSGTPDYLIARPTAKYPGMFLEMKRSDMKGKRMRPNQLECLARLKEAGYYCCVCYSANEAIQETEKYLSGVL